jgi:hypothetical protein
LPLVQESQKAVPTQQSNKLKIEQSPDTINIQIEEIPQTDTSDRLIKTVSWSDTVNAEKLESQQKEIDALKIQVNELLERVKNLEENFPMNKILQ